ncbi:leucine-rich repeat-containing protein 59-like [Cylas formicarius]|uniref:leucine-rich repeat-containing protein 59-like n=1 Tax=Cylas formicarius TaxID=197179 RepID=UPI0029584F80|nr:leucine-rich repeat-containing protein 59-like [Cylas formicarius]
MASNTKVNVKERFSDGEIDLSMSDLDDVPVKEIAALRKTTSLDLSNNRLTKLPDSFTVLINLTKLDLSKNELKELPEDFGKLTKLKHLDLYRNNLERLPLSFGELKDLRFLDLKDNPLVSAIAKIAGPCVDHKGCLNCAKDIVAFYRKLQKQLEGEVEMRKKTRQKQIEQDQHKKQEEKKNKAKQKQKEKQKVLNNEVKKSVNSKKASKKTKKVADAVSSSRPLWRLIKAIIFLLGVAGSALFVFTSVKYEPVRWVVPFCSEYYYAILSKFPSEYRVYGKSLANATSQFHDKTGEFVLLLADRVGSSELYRHVLNRIKEIFSSFVK